MPSPTDAPVSPPAQVAAAEGELPAEIEDAIDAYGSAEADSFDLSISLRKRGLAATRAAETRAALTTAILARLTAAERCCDSYARENQQLSDKVDAAIAERDWAYVGAGECCDGYEGQIAMLQQVIKDRTAERDEARAELHEALHGEEAEGVLQGLKIMVGARDAAEAQLSTALARAERAESLQKLLSDAQPTVARHGDEIVLHCPDGTIADDLYDALEAASYGPVLAHPAPAEET